MLELSCVLSVNVCRRHTCSIRFQKKNEILLAATIVQSTFTNETEKRSVINVCIDILHG